MSENIMRTNFMINEIDNFIDYCSFNSNNFHSGPFSLFNFFQEIESIFESGIKKKKLNLRNCDPILEESEFYNNKNRVFIRFIQDFIYFGFLIILFPYNESSQNCLNKIKYVPQ